MTIQSPIVLASGFFSQLFPGDTVPGTDTTAQASGNAALVRANTALASGNAGISTGLTALASGNAGLVSASNKVPISGGYMTGQLFAASGVVVSGTLSRNGFNVVTVGDVETVTSTMIASGTIIDADVNISGAINATKLNFLQTGTSAVARTVDSKLKDVVSVKDFGAVGDGVADDTAAIQAAINAALASPKAFEVFFPSGEYLVSAPLTIGFRSGAGAGQIFLKLRGVGPAGNARGFYPATVDGSTIKAAAGFTGSYVLGHVRTPSTYGFQGIEIEGISVNANSVANHGIYIDNPVGVTLARVNVYRALNTGIYLNAVDGDGFNVNIRDAYIWGGTFATLAQPSLYGIQSNARYALFDRVVMDGGQVGIKSSGDHCIITNCHLEGSLTAIDATTGGGGFCRIVNNFIFPYGVGASGWTGSTTGILLSGTGIAAGLFNRISSNTIWSTAGTSPTGINFSSSYANTVTDNVFYGHATNGACIVTDSASASAEYTLDSNWFNTSGVVVNNLYAGGKIHYSSTNKVFGGAAPSFTGQTSYIFDHDTRLLLGFVSNAGNLQVKNTADADAVNLVGNSYEYLKIRGYQVDNGFNAAASTIKVGKEVFTSRSINAAGTVNASGADYAEYMTKAGVFDIAKGAICGITSEGLVTNVYADSVSFVVKSTNPSYVGGDTWASADVIGTKPDADDADALIQWEADLEAARQAVDRIAFAGQVPVNVIGAASGQYIVPIADTDGGIEGIAKDETDLTLAEYMRTVGKVITIESDGRARIIVKVA